jgi:hypothetical protein
VSGKRVKPEAGISRRKAEGQKLKVDRKRLAIYNSSSVDDGGKVE